MQILEETIKTRWNVLPEEQQKGIRQFLSNVIISVATNGDFAKQRVYLQKLNLVLVQVCISNQLELACRGLVNGLLSLEATRM